MNELTNFVIQPKTLTEAMDFAKMIASSSFCPAAMKGKPGDVILAMQMGAEVGLSPMQALQNIAVISGKPCLYGDGALAVAMSSPNYLAHREWFEGSIKDGTLTAYCGITRKGSDEYVRAFSMEDAKKANLWSKQGVWQQYPDRMLQMRARSFAIRDKFADALRGINMAEEVNDYDVKSVKATNVRIVQSSTPLLDHIEDSPTGEVIEPHNNESIASLKDFISLIKSAKDINILKEVYVKAVKKSKAIPSYLAELEAAKNEAKERIETELDLARVPLDDISQHEEVVAENNGDHL